MNDLINIYENLIDKIMRNDNITHFNKILYLL